MNWAEQELELVCCYFFCCRGWCDEVLIIVPVAIGYFIVFLCYDLNFSGLLNPPKIYIFSCMLQLCNIYASYILLRLCVGMSALALFSSLVVRILSTHLQGAWEVIHLTCLMIYFIMSAFYVLAWLYVTWQPCMELHMWQNCNEPTPRVTFAYGNDNYEQLVHWGEFSSKWLDA